MTMKPIGWDRYLQACTKLILFCNKELKLNEHQLDHLCDTMVELMERVNDERYEGNPAVER